MSKPDEVTVERGRAGTVEVVAVVGELDVASAPALRTQLEQVGLGDADGPTSLLVDLAGVPFIDSTALGVLVGTLRRTQDAGVGFAIVVAHPHVLKVLEVTGLVDLMSVYPDRDSALAAITAAGFRQSE